MIFTSISFIYYFLPLLFIIYFIVPKKCKNFILLLFSLLFYFYGEPKYILLMILEVIISFIGGIFLEKNNDKYLLILLIVLHVLFLFVFKYLDFTIININNLFKTNIGLYNLILPIGISFYTFQIISYEVDIYRNEVKAQRNFFSYALYVFFFPQLIAGPIVRYKDINESISNRTINLDNIFYGINRFIIGLSKKVIIANNLGELCNVLLGSNLNVLSYWLYAISYMLQIYYDFSGYSDIAIGLGNIFGFNFPENFNYPFIAKSITDFWRRWHMTLSNWFKDYIYIPLGGNRKGTLKQIRNILIVWCLTGLWHGASWNFLLWGLYFGILLILEKFIVNKIKINIPKVFRIVLVLFLIMISFIIFGFDDINQIKEHIIGLFNIKNGLFDNFSIYYLKSYCIFIIVGIVGAGPLIKNLFIKIRKNKYLNFIINILQPLFLVVLLYIVTLYLIDGSYNPFLYFRF